MRNERLKIYTRITFTAIIFIIGVQAIFAQTNCLTDADIKQMLARLDAPGPTAAAADENLRAELLKMRAEGVESLQKTLEKNSKDKNPNQINIKPDEKATARFCEILQRHGFPTENLVGKDGVAAAYYLLKNHASVQLQAALLPVLTAAVNKNRLEKNEDYASFLDRLRLRAGLRQVFGTQAKIENGFLVLYPLASEQMADEWRAQFNMPPLKEYLRFLEIYHKMPLIKSLIPAADAVGGEKRANESNARTTTEKNGAAIVSAASSTAAAPPARTTAAPDSLLENGAVEKEEVIRVETNAVNLNVVVFGGDRKTPVGNLEKNDFRVFEDGREQEISFFAKTEAPFDLVLLIDLSGSTADKINLIRKTARSFIEAKRPTDRLAIVTFATEVSVVAPLTHDREKLLASAKDIKGRGSSYVWDALQYTLTQVFEQKNPAQQRRRAVVMMTDGVDNALMFYRGVGSRTLFADLLENVRRGDTAIIPIYLDTEGNDPFSKKVYADARRTLALLAESSGGLYYQARKIEDLEGVYQQVLNDLSQVYTIGYEPSNDRRDGAWRALKVEIRNRPELKAHAKSGYYAR
jgi:VWFA-related protein